MLDTLANSPRCLMDRGNHGLAVVEFTAMVWETRTFRISKAEPTTAWPWWPPRPWLAAWHFILAILRPWSQPILCFSDLKRIRVEREEGVEYKGQAIRVEWGSLVLEELHKSSHKFSAEFFFSSLLVFVFYFLNVVLHSYGLYFDKHVWVVLLF